MKKIFYILTIIASIGSSKELPIIKEDLIRANYKNIEVQTRTIGVYIIRDVA